MKEIRKIIVAITLLLMASCSVEKNTSSTRFYHGLTARYNIYFNGHESFKQGEQKVINNYSDDFAEVLHVFEYSDARTPTLCSSEMDRAIQKSSKLIRLKSITAKPKESRSNPQNVDPDEALLNRKEYNEWVDDAYLLMAKSNFYKFNFQEAEKIFNYCVENANDEGIRKEAMIWIARIYSEKADYLSSLRVLNEFDYSEELPRPLKAMYQVTYADLFIKQKRYEEAVPYLEKGIPFLKGKRTRYRLTFLLAQLYQQVGDLSSASAYYHDVIKMNPPYDVEFNARISLAGAYDAKMNEADDVRRELEKMLKNPKNENYQDQIYYAMGTISMREDNIEEATSYFLLSASSQSSNPNQKARTYIALADYYFNKNNLIKSAAYFDSTMAFLTERYSEYQSVKEKASNVSAVASQLSIIQEQDSLQRVANMSEQERNSLINNIIAKITEAERLQQTTGSDDRYNLGQFYENERRAQNTIEQEGSWYFYNQAALTFGRTEFKRRYGDRPLEDNWRRSNKTTVIDDFVGELQEAEEGGEAAGETAVAANKKPEYYLANLPLTDTLMAVSKEKVANAYFNVGKAFNERLKDVANASKYYELLLSRFPDHELEAEAIYNLYLINKEVNNSKSESYRQRLLQKYPETEFAKIITDPDYNRKKMESMKVVERLYETVYNSYLTEDFNRTIEQCDKALNDYPEDALAPKFMLLKAYSVARISDERAFKEALTVVVDGWPNSEEGTRAKEIISFLNQEIPILKIEEDIEIAQEIYTKNLSENHVFALVIEDPAFNINLANFDVISYNIDNYTNSNYRTQGELTDNKYIIITVSGFPKYSDALDYYQNFNLTKVVRNPTNAKMYVFLISLSNQRVLSEDRNPERYRLFFQENYLQPTEQPQP